ncbi:MAG: DUF3137 domain-containing protein [Planctomycetes bacterium]|nr:DUF3137 domain-containing protein [Planctomycetota bacterium]
MGILRNVFGPSREEIWRGLAAEVGGTFVEGDFWKRGQIRATRGDWTVTLDTFFSAASKCDYTRVRAHFLNPEGFRFTVYRRGFFSDIAKWFGMEDVEVGHEEFDRDFILKGSDHGRLRALFSNAKVRELIAAQPQIHFTVQQAKGELGAATPAHTDELSFVAVGVIRDGQRLRLLFDLFAETLDQLCRMGAAYEGQA